MKSAENKGTEESREGKNLCGTNVKVEKRTQNRKEKV
jgi:hypothetical protein